ncbi:ABC transporter ATP-binding protein [Paenibacillus tepidiphilus]|uniref:ABC transporter ATP-binding protein n=1 Tax=Paenibacillus tepidiphilus TaxID=2608683 RepID=UPI00123C3ABF|nr:ABC transporter ATP-binding protein [Paenibacillus tepidiphilus]
MGYNKRASDADSNAIVLSGANKSLNGAEIIRNVSFHVPYNSIYAIVGPNCAGKTTLLRLITGLLTLDAGRIHFTGDAREVSVLLEHDYLFEAKTGRENLRDFASYLEIDQAQVPAVTLKYAGLLQLDTALNQKVATYSKGMRRKLSLLITLLKDTPILMLDELTSGVDPEARRAMRGMLELLKEEGKTVIITSHDLAEVQKISDWSTILINGAVAETINLKDFTGDLEARFFEVLEGSR